MSGIRVIPVLLGLALALGACSGGSPGQTSESAQTDGWRDYSRAEEKWLGKLGAWRESMDIALRTRLLANTDPEATRALKAGELEAVNTIRTALEVLKSCTTTFRDQVGSAPTPRMREAADATKVACPDLEQGATEDLRSLDEGDPEVLDAGDGFIELGAESLWEANKQVLAGAEGRNLREVDAPSDESRTNPRLGRAADALGQNLATATEVRCWSREDWPDILDELSAYYGSRPHGVLLGFASVDLVRINLAPSICDALDDLVYRRPELDADHANAVLALAHEAMHVAWVPDEAEATCYALQAVEDTSIRLGMSRRDGHALAEIAWADVYPKLPAKYRYTECADGRSLDVNPDSTEWP